MRGMWLAATAMGLVSASATAQVAEPEPGTTEDDAGTLTGIIVTAQRREQLLSEVPAAVAVVTGDEFTRSGFTSLDDLQQTVPSLTFGASATARGEGLVIRGFGTTSFSDAAEGAVGIVVDGVVLGRQASGLLDLIDIDRIEVLRGPQGTLFGKNASAGVVNIITKRPTDQFEADGRVRYGSDDLLQLAATVSGPIAPGRLSARITGFRNTRDGILNQVNPAFSDEKLNDQNAYGARAKLLFTPGGGADILLTGEYQKQDVLCCNWTRRSFAPPAAGALAALERGALTGFYTPGPDNRDVALTIRSNFQRSETYAGTLDINVPIGTHTLRSITGYRGFDIQEGNKTDQLPISFFDLAATNSNIDQYTQELQILSPDGPFEYVAGLYFFRLGVDSVQRQEASFSTIPGVGNIPGPLVPLLLPPALVPLFPPTTRVNIQNQAQQTTNYAVFGQASYELTPELTVTAGARLLREELDVRFDRSGGLPLGAFAQVIPLVDPAPVKDTAVTYTGSLRYAFTPDVSVYGTYSRGYKGRAYDLNAGSPVVFRADGTAIFEALDPEKVDNFEIGLRSLVLNDRVQFNATAFNTTVKDYQAASQRTDGIPGFVLNNVGEFRTRGLEFETLIRPARTFLAGFNLTLLDAEYTDFPNGECPNPFVANRPASCISTGRQDLSGRQAANAPDISGSAFAEHTLPLGGFELVSRGEVTFRSDTLYSLTQDPNTIQDGYALVNARVTLRSDRGYEVSGFVRNLFDVDYAESIFSTPVFTGGYSQFIANDRQFGVEARVSFGR